MTRREFSWEGALNRYVGSWESSQLGASGFDLGHYSRLQREAARLGDLLAAQKRAAAAAAAQAAAAAAEADGGESKK